MDNNNSKRPRKSSNKLLVKEVPSPLLKSEKSKQSRATPSKKSESENKKLVVNENYVLNNKDKIAESLKKDLESMHGQQTNHEESLSQLYVPTPSQAPSQVPSQGPSQLTSQAPTNGHASLASNKQSGVQLKYGEGSNSRNSQLAPKGTSKYSKSRGHHGDEAFTPVKAGSLPPLSQGQITTPNSNLTAVRRQRLQASKNEPLKTSARGLEKFSDTGDKKGSINSQVHSAQRPIESKQKSVKQHIGTPSLASIQKKPSSVAPIKQLSNQKLLNSRHGRQRSKQSKNHDGTSVKSSQTKNEAALRVQNLKKHDDHKSQSKRGGSCSLSSSLDSKDKSPLLPPDPEKKLGNRAEEDSPKTSKRFTKEQIQLLKSIEDQIMQKAHKEIAEEEKRQESMKSGAFQGFSKDAPLLGSTDPAKIRSELGGSNINPIQSQGQPLSASPFKSTTLQKSLLAPGESSTTNVKKSTVSKQDSAMNVIEEPDDSINPRIEDAIVDQGEGNIARTDGDESDSDSFDPNDLILQQNYNEVDEDGDDGNPDAPQPSRKRQKDKIVVLDSSNNLPTELPTNLVYWNRCETRVLHEDFISNSKLVEFYKEEFKHHEDMNGDVAKVSDQPPYFRGKPMFADPRQEKFVSRQEEKILTENKWPDGMKKFSIEGHIILAKVNESTVFFNSKFETGNLRQVFRGDNLDPASFQPQPTAGTSALEPIPEAGPSELKIKESGLNVTSPSPVPEAPALPKKIYTEYNLYLQDDTNSDNSLTQWFYFSCMNLKKGTVIRLNMVNLMKDDSLYSQGMQPFVYSKKRHLEGDGQKWHREGFNIEYYYNDKTIRTNSKTLDLAFDSRYVDNLKDKFKRINTLSFCYEFQYDNDMVFFAHFAPYSYSDVFRYFCKLECDESLKDIMRIDYICRTLGKTPMYGLTITNKIQEDYITQAEEIELFRQFEYQGLNVKPKKKKIIIPGLPGYEETLKEKTLIEKLHDMILIRNKEEEAAEQEKLMAFLNALNNPKQADQKKKKKDEIPSQSKEASMVVQNPQVNQVATGAGGAILDEQRPIRYKKYVFLTSRVHPGETNSQYMIQGVISFLLSNDPTAIELRNRFIFKVIPILNPDGVIHGNYRASLMGVDLNRRWKNPSKFLHPTIYYTKSLIRFYHTLASQPDSDSGGVILSCDFHGHSRNMNVFMYACKNFGDEANVRVPNQIISSIPENVAHHCPIFGHKECKMTVEKEKDSTARIVLFKEFGIQNSYTLECTFFGSEYFRKPRPNWIKVISPEEQEEIHKRYEVNEERTDIHITPDNLIDVGQDFCRGILLASSKRIVQSYWFDEPRKHEAIKAKEQAIIQNQQKQLEKIKEMEREQAKQAALEEKKRQKEQKAMLLAQRKAQMLEKVEEEGEVKHKRKKKKKKQQDFTAWDDQQEATKDNKVEEQEGEDSKADPKQRAKPAKAKPESKDFGNQKKKTKKKQEQGKQLPNIKSPVLDKKKKAASKSKVIINGQEVDSSFENAFLHQMQAQGDGNNGQQSFNYAPNIFLKFNNNIILTSDPSAQGMNHQQMSGGGLSDQLMNQFNRMARQQQTNHFQDQYLQHLQQSGNPRLSSGVYSLNQPVPGGQIPEGFSAISPRRALDSKIQSANIKMTELVDQILNDDLEVGCYQQNVLFPQYSMPSSQHQKPLGAATSSQEEYGGTNSSVSPKGYPKVNPQFIQANNNSQLKFSRLTSDQYAYSASKPTISQIPLQQQQPLQDQSDSNQSKLRRVSKLMNEMAKVKTDVKERKESSLLSRGEEGKSPRLLKKQVILQTKNLEFPQNQTPKNPGRLEPAILSNQEYMNQHPLQMKFPTHHSSESFNRSGGNAEMKTLDQQDIQYQLFAHQQQEASAEKSRTSQGSANTRQPLMASHVNIGSGLNPSAQYGNHHYFAPQQQLAQNANQFIFKRKSLQQLNMSAGKFEGMAVVGQQVMAGSEYVNFRSAEESRQGTEGSTRDGEKRVEDQYEKYKRFELNQRKKYNEQREQQLKHQDGSKQDLIDLSKTSDGDLVSKTEDPRKDEEELQDKLITEKLTQVSKAGITIDIRTSPQKSRLRKKGKSSRPTSALKKKKKQTDLHLHEKVLHELHQQANINMNSSEDEGNHPPKRLQHTSIQRTPRSPAQILSHQSLDDKGDRADSQTSQQAIQRMLNYTSSSSNDDETKLFAQGHNKRANHSPQKSPMTKNPKRHLGHGSHISHSGHAGHQIQPGHQLHGGHSVHAGHSSHIGHAGHLSHIAHGPPSFSRNFHKGGKVSPENMTQTTDKSGASRIEHTLKPEIMSGEKHRIRSKYDIGTKPQSQVVTHLQNNPHHMKHQFKNQNQQPAEDKNWNDITGFGDEDKDPLFNQPKASSTGLSVNNLREMGLKSLGQRQLIAQSQEQTLQMVQQLHSKEENKRKRSNPNLAWVPAVVNSNLNQGGGGSQKPDSKFNHHNSVAGVNLDSRSTSNIMPIYHNTDHSLSSNKKRRLKGDSGVQSNNVATIVSLQAPTQQAALSPAPKRGSTLGQSLYQPQVKFPEIKKSGAGFPLNQPVLVGQPMVNYDIVYSQPDNPSSGGKDPILSGVKSLKPSAAKRNLGQPTSAGNNSGNTSVLGGVPMFTQQPGSANPYNLQPSFSQNSSFIGLPPQSLATSQSAAAAAGMLIMTSSAIAGNGSGQKQLEQVPMTNSFIPTIPPQLYQLQQQQLQMQMQDQSPQFQHHQALADGQQPVSLQQHYLAKQSSGSKKQISHKMFINSGEGEGSPLLNEPTSGGTARKI